MKTDVNFLSYDLARWPGCFSPLGRSLLVIRSTTCAPMFPQRRQNKMFQRSYFLTTGEKNLIFFCKVILTPELRCGATLSNEAQVLQTLAHPPWILNRQFQQKFNFTRNPISIVNFPLPKTPKRLCVSNNVI